MVTPPDLRQAHRVVVVIYAMALLFASFPSYGALEEWVRGTPRE